MNPPRPADLVRLTPAVCSCGAYVPDVAVPTATGPVARCWLCAHAIVFHGADAHDAASIAHALDFCGCRATDVYPEDVLLRRGRGLAEVARERAGLPAPGEADRRRDRVRRLAESASRLRR